MSETAAPSKRRENTRQRLFEAAAEVFAEVGLDAASVEMICDRAGFTRGAFYSNFDSKNDLVTALTAAFADEKLERVSERVRELDGEADGLDDLIARVIDICVDSRADTLLLAEIRTHALRDEALAETHRALDRQMLRRVTALVDEVARVSSLRLRLPVEEFARILIDVWTATSLDGAIARADTERVAARLRERTTILARALTEPLA